MPHASAIYGYLHIIVCISIRICYGYYKACTKIYILTGRGWAKNTHRQKLSHSNEWSCAPSQASTPHCGARWHWGLWSLTSGWDDGDFKGHLVLLCATAPWVRWRGGSCLLHLQTRNQAQGTVWMWESHPVFFFWKSHYVTEQVMIILFLKKCFWMRT